MRSGIEKKRNPYEPPLGRYLRALERPLTAKHVRAPRNRKPRPEKFIHEPPMPRQKTRPRDRKTRRREKMPQYVQEVLALDKAIKAGVVRQRYAYAGPDKPDQLIEAWRQMGRASRGTR